MTPARNQSFDYDVLDRLDEADGAYGLITYAHDGVGNRASRTIDDGQTILSELYSYDAFSNRLLSVTPSSGPTRSFTYTANGQVATDDAGPVTPSDFTYDLSNRLVGVIQSGVPAAAYVHNALGQRLVKDLNGTVTHYHYDRAGQLIAESDGFGTVAREYLHLEGLPLANIEAGGSGPLSADIVLDNTDPGASGLGPWSSDVTAPDYLGPDYDARVGGDGSGHFDWTPTLPWSGLYQVYARWPEMSETEGSTAQYTVIHADGTSNLIVDQRGGSGGWSLLGTFPLTMGAGHGVSLSDAAEPSYAPGGSPPSEGGEFIVDSDDPSVTAVVSWPNQSGYSGAYGPDYRRNCCGSGAEYLTWPIPMTEAGRYKVYARWPKITNNDASVPFTVHHDGGTTNRYFNQKVIGGMWIILGSFDFTPGAGHKVVVTDDIGWYVAADAVRFVKDTSASGSSEFIADNTHAGTSTVGSWGTYAGVPGFFWTNFRHSASIGTGSKVFTWPMPITQSGRYKVYARWAAASNYATDAPYTVTHAGGTTTVRVDQRYNGGQWNLLGSFDLALGAGHKVSLSDDTDFYAIADAIRFVLDAGASEAEEFVVDNTDGGASAQGAWAGGTAFGGFHGEDYHFKAAGTGTDSFTWTAPVTQAGRTKVYVRWPSSGTVATNAPFTVTHAGGTHTLELNQRLNSREWLYLGSYPMEPGKGHGVTLTDAANGSVVADAVRFVTDTSTSDPGVFPHSVAADAVRFVSNDAEAPLYVHADQLGTPQKMTDQAAALAWDRVQRPFGQTVSLTGPATNPQRFPGQLHDPETGFHYNYFRDYDAGIGRYLQSDPIGLAGGLNTYGYVGGNPVNSVDPMGLLPTPLPPWRTRTRDCNSDEYAACQKACGPSGVQSCKISQTWRITRMKNGLSVWGWNDGPMSCSCNEAPKDCPKFDFDTPWWVPLIPFLPFLTPWPDPY